MRSDQPVPTAAAKTKRPAAVATKRKPGVAVAKPKPAVAVAAAAKPKPAVAVAAAAKPKPVVAVAKLKPAAAAKPKPAAAAVKPKPFGRECEYTSITFRSTYEARWALYLDLLGIDWDYEPCHYLVGAGLKYLPDFYLPQYGMWLEVKGIPFMNIQSMAKVVNAVAGPHPIPQRNHPYDTAGKILLGGSFRALGDSRTPVHTIVTPAPAGAKAEFTHHRMVPGPKGGIPEFKAIGKAYLSVKADGTKAASCPTDAELKKMLEAPHHPEPAPKLVADAFRAVLKAAFDPKNSQLIIPENAAPLAKLRRGGRPLGQAW